MSAACSIGCNCGINEFKIHCIEPQCDAIGITTNIKELDNKDIWINDIWPGYTYFLYIYSGLVVSRYTVENTEESNQIDVENTVIDDNAILTIRI